jgi:hypothetical protein
VFASTFKSEKSFEVSSASLRNSEVSRVARLQNSSPTTTKKITLRRILESDNTAELYSKPTFNSTTTQKRAETSTGDTRWCRSARTGKCSGDGWRTLLLWKGGKRRVGAPPGGRSETRYCNAWVQL